MFLQLLNSQAVNFIHHKIKIFHSPGPVGLGQVNIMVSGGKGLQQLVVGLHIQAQLSPHWLGVTHLKNRPSLKV